MTPRVEIRPTTPANLGLVTELLSERDGHALNPAHVSTALAGLKPEHLAGWIVLADGRPAGFSCLYLRRQRWDTAGERTIRAGYWAHLFVREEFRRLMLYPQLVLAMMRGIQPLGIDAIFTGTRRRHVAEGHVKLGFAKLGEIGVLFKPLRPFRLLARYKNAGSLAWAARPADAAYTALRGTRQRVVPGTSIREVGPAEAPLDEAASLLEQSTRGRVAQVWASDALARRLSGAIDGRAYRILLAEHSGQLAGFAVIRIAERQRICTGVIMEVVTPPGESETAEALVAQCERRLHLTGADTTLFLDGLGPTTHELLASSGHRRSSETYNMLVWPKTLVPPGSAAADLANWRFSFLDHDAF